MGATFVSIAPARAAAGTTVTLQVQMPAGQFGPGVNLPPVAPFNGVLTIRNAAGTFEAYANCVTNDFALPIQTVTFVVPVVSTGQKIIEVTTRNSATVFKDQMAVLEVIAAAPTNAVQVAAPPATALPLAVGIRVPELRRTKIVVTGTGWVDDETTVKVVTANGAGEDVSCTDVIVQSSTRLTCTVPALKAGACDLVVTVADVGDTTYHETGGAVLYVPVLTLNGAMMAVKFTGTGLADTAADLPLRVKSQAVAIDVEVETDEVPPLRTSDLYDASGVGLSWTKNHYHQIFDACEILRESLAVEHEEDGTSILSVLGIKSVERVTSDVDIDGVGFSETKELIEHEGALWSGFAQLHTPVTVDADGETLTTPTGDTAICGFRFAFDSTKIYQVVSVDRIVPGGLNEFRVTADAYLFQPGSGSSLTPVDAPNFVNPGRQGYSFGADVYTRMLANAEIEESLVDAEHDIASGRHSYPFSKVTGYSKFFDATVQAPAAVGSIATILVSSAQYRDSLFIQPMLIGDAGSGIVSASMGFSGAAVFLVLRRLTAGTTNSFRAVCWSVRDK